MNPYLLGPALAVALIVTHTPAGAETTNGAAEIQRGDYPAAERTILQQLRMWPDDADLLLNLATIYGRTGRLTEARAAYRLVLAQPDDELDLADRRVETAHAMARNALTAMDRAQQAAR